MGESEVRVLLTTWGSRGDVEPLVGLAVALRELGAEARVCAPPDEDFARLLARAGVPLVPLGPTVRSVVAGPKPPTAQDAFRLAAALVAARFDTLTAAARGMRRAAGDRPDAGRRAGRGREAGHPLRVRVLRRSSGCRRGTSLRGRGRARRSRQDETDNRVLWEQDAQAVNALYGEALNSHRAAIGLPPVDNVRDHVFTDRPWLAADPALCPSQGLTDLDLVQTGAWIAARRPSAPGRAGGVPGRRRTTGVRGLRQHGRARPEGPRPGGHRGDPRAGPPRPRSPAAGPTWP